VQVSEPRKAMRYKQKLERKLWSLNRAVMPQLACKNFKPTSKDGAGSARTGGMLQFYINGT
jgi:hypothetical protein